MIDELRDEPHDELWSTQLKSHVAKIGGHCPSEGGHQAFFCISRNHMITESSDLVGEIPDPKSQKL